MASLLLKVQYCFYSTCPGSCSAQLNMKCIMLTNVKMPTLFTNVGILTVIRMVNTISESWKAGKSLCFSAF